MNLFKENCSVIKKKRFYFLFILFKQLKIFHLLIRTVTFYIKKNRQLILHNNKTKVKNDNSIH